MVNTPSHSHIPSSARGLLGVPATSPFAALAACREAPAATRLPACDAADRDERDVWREACLAAQQRPASESDLPPPQPTSRAGSNVLCASPEAAAAAAAVAVAETAATAPTAAELASGVAPPTTPTMSMTPTPSPTAAVATAADSLKPLFHVMPVNGWGSDPNGPIFYKGRYHLFYQARPGTCQWYWGMCWDHVVSTDLAHWERLPMALVPTPGGIDADGCFSGSIQVEPQSGIPVCFYTAARLRTNREVALPHPPPSHDMGLKHIETQCCAICDPDDELLAKWRKVPMPLMELPHTGQLTAWRDPWFVEQGDGRGKEWTMLIGSGLKDGGGTALVYRTQDITRGWRFVGHLCSWPNPGTGICWECPFLVQLQPLPLCAHVLPTTTMAAAPPAAAVAAAAAAAEAEAKDLAQRCGGGADRAPWAPYGPPDCTTASCETISTTLSGRRTSSVEDVDEDLSGVADGDGANESEYDDLANGVGVVRRRTTFSEGAYGVPIEPVSDGQPSAVAAAAAAAAASVALAATAAAAPPAVLPPQADSSALAVGLVDTLMQVVSAISPTTVHGSGGGGGGPTAAAVSGAGRAAADTAHSPSGDAAPTPAGMPAGGGIGISVTAAAASAGGGGAAGDASTVTITVTRTATVAGAEGGTAAAAGPEAAAVGSVTTATATVRGGGGDDGKSATATIQVTVTPLPAAALPPQPSPPITPLPSAPHKVAAETAPAAPPSAVAPAAGGGRGGGSASATPPASRRSSIVRTSNPVSSALTASATVAADAAGDRAVLQDLHSMVKQVMEAHEARTRAEADAAAVVAEYAAMKAERGGGGGAAAAASDSDGGDCKLSYCPGVMGHSAVPEPNTEIEPLPAPVTMRYHKAQPLLPPGASYAAADVAAGGGGAAAASRLPLHGDVDSTSDHAHAASSPPRRRWFFCCAPDACTYSIIYWLSEYDSKTAKYDMPGAEADGRPRKLDLGNVLYAPTCFKDPQGRHILWGYMKELRNVPAPPCLCNKYSYAGCVSLPRALYIRGDKLFQLPLPELTALRSDVAVHVSQVALTHGSPWRLSGVRGLHLDMELAVSPGTAQRTVVLFHSWRPHGRGAAALVYDWTSRRLYVVFEAMHPRRQALWRGCAQEPLSTQPPPPQQPQPAGTSPLPPTTMTPTTRTRPERDVDAADRASASLDGGEESPAGGAVFGCPMVETDLCPAEMSRERDEAFNSGFNGGDGDGDGGEGEGEGGGGRASPNGGGGGEAAGLDELDEEENTEYDVIRDPDFIPDPDMNPLVEDWIRMKRDEAGGELDLPPGSPLRLRLFLDASCLEVFTGSGQVLTTRVYRGHPPLHPQPHPHAATATAVDSGPDSGGPDPGIEILAVGGSCRLDDLHAYEVHSAWSAPPPESSCAEEGHPGEGREAKRLKAAVGGDSSAASRRGAAALKRLCTALGVLTQQEHLPAHNLSYAVASCRGWRVAMEDTYAAEVPLHGDCGLAMFALYDGHGGAEVARFSALHMGCAIREAPSARAAFATQYDTPSAASPAPAAAATAMAPASARDPAAAPETAAGENSAAAAASTAAAAAAEEGGGGGGDGGGGGGETPPHHHHHRHGHHRHHHRHRHSALREAFLSLDRQLADEAHARELMALANPGALTAPPEARTAGGPYRGPAAGSTASVALVGLSGVTVAAVGDSRCILGSRAGGVVALTVDHKGSDEVERERVVRAGCWVSASGRVCGELDMSRALGDADMKQAAGLPPHLQAVTADPTVMTIRLQPAARTTHPAPPPQPQPHPDQEGQGMERGAPSTGPPPDAREAAPQQPQQRQQTEPDGGAGGGGAAAAGGGGPDPWVGRPGPGPGSASGPGAGEPGGGVVAGPGDLGRGGGDGAGGGGASPASGPGPGGSAGGSGAAAGGSGAGGAGGGGTGGGGDGGCYLLLASDGLWNVLDTQMVHEFVLERLEAGVAAESICAQLCVEACVSERTAYDNVTVLLVQMHGVAPAGEVHVDAAVEAAAAEAEAAEAEAEAGPPPVGAAAAAAGEEGEIAEGEEMKVEMAEGGTVEEGEEKEAEEGEEAAARAEEVQQLAGRLWSEVAAPSAKPLCAAAQSLSDAMEASGGPREALCGRSVGKEVERGSAVAAGSGSSSKSSLEWLDGPERLEGEAAPAGPLDDAVCRIWVPMSMGGSAAPGEAVGFCNDGPMMTDWKAGGEGMAGTGRGAISSSDERLLEPSPMQEDGPVF
ncbi:Putative beta-Fructufuranosidase [Pleodorina starrii]|nr:Putative beta-Fructufuranosidase [Pleodorina starrii]